MLKNPSGKITFSLLLLVWLIAPSYNGMSKERPKPVIIMWWNVENLFDTKDDKHVNDREFTPGGTRHWTNKKLLLKRLRIEQVLRAIEQKREYGHYPDIIAFAETENRQVFEGTLKSIDHARYRINYHESPDPRGIDIGLAWNPHTVTFTSSKPYRVTLDNGRGTRYVIAAGFLASGHPFTVVLNHWPSRSFDAKWSEPKRIAAAKVARHIVDSLVTRHSMAKIIVMGDFNDTPADRSLRLLGSSFNKRKVRHSGGNRLLYNCWNDTKTPGTYYYRKHWRRIDQMLVSPALLDGKQLRIDSNSFRVFSLPEMFNHPGKTLYATYQHGKFKGGYSDHLPLLLKIGVMP
ncbi:MAG TPA: endonuclease/exonuclease/phosphatase family protein [Chlorobaculum parvum]|uniref:Endonuclease/exonuclease/phosphatase family protein n=1 Tax=Chlorobaculum parvum TaxID=274539 RepID=A0A7C5HAU7_9CHLB|nr:endonuclease/exonuclease/phosphatase family protein [Chlorobaculum parvum]